MPTEGQMAVQTCSTEGEIKDASWDVLEGFIKQSSYEQERR